VEGSGSEDNGNAGGGAALGALSWPCTSSSEEGTDSAGCDGSSGEFSSGTDSASGGETQSGSDSGSENDLDSGTDTDTCSGSGSGSGSGSAENITGSAGDSSAGKHPPSTPPAGVSQEKWDRELARERERMRQRRQRRRCRRHAARKAREGEGPPLSKGYKNCDGHVFVIICRADRQAFTVCSAWKDKYSIKAWLGEAFEDGVVSGGAASVGNDTATDSPKGGSQGRWLMSRAEFDVWFARYSMLIAKRHWDQEAVVVMGQLFGIRRLTGDPPASTETGVPLFQLKPATAVQWELHVSTAPFTNGDGNAKRHLRDLHAAMLAANSHAAEYLELVAMRHMQTVLQQHSPPHLHRTSTLPSYSPAAMALPAAGDASEAGAERALWRAQTEQAARRVPRCAARRHVSSAGTGTAVSC
jgi:hypothetical protein